MKKLFSLLLFLTIYFQHAYAQSPKNTSILQEINQQVWYPFSKAYKNLDYQIMADIHHKDLVRVAGNKKEIKNYKNYIKHHKKSFKRAKTHGYTRDIMFSFLERIYTENKASERGYYRLIVNEGRYDEKTYYGKFHVVLLKEKGIWKIWMDYDSNEKNTVVAIDFEKAHHLEDVASFE